MDKKCELNCGEKVLDVIVTQEKIGKKIFFVVQGIQIDVASQGLTLEEALQNIKDAAEERLKNSSEIKQEIEEDKEITQPLLTRVFL